MISGLGRGGAERQLVMLARELVRGGHDVCIYTLTKHVPRADELRGTSIELVVDQKRRRLDVQVLARLRAHLARWQPDVVHSFLYDGNVYARLAGWGTGVPVLGSERSDNYRLGAVQRLGYRLTAALTDGVVANTHAGAAHACKVQYQRAERVHTVWNGIDLRQIDEAVAVGGRPAEQMWPGPCKRVCVVGSIKPEKDQLLALRVARRLVDAGPGWRFIFAGDSLWDAATDYKKEVLEACEQMRLRDAVRFVGHREDVPALMASCDVVLVTSRWEGFPNVVLEAMACGTPVVSTAYSDVRRILPMPWQVVASREEAELAEAIARAAAQRGEVAAEQRRWVEAHATAAASAQAMLQVYARHVRPHAVVPRESLP